MTRPPPGPLQPPGGLGGTLVAILLWGAVVLLQWWLGW
jgi:hypothetical protein